VKFKRKLKQFKKCPRCGNKCLANQSKCEECELLFSRLEYASNKKAKKHLIKFDRDYVIYTKDLPSDVQWWKLLLLTIFTGLVGGQYYYVGKYVKGMLMSFSFTLLMFCTIFNAYIVEYIETLYLYLPIGVAGLAWIVSLVYVLSRRFKVPILVDIPFEVKEDMKSKRADYERVRSEIEIERQKLGEEKNLVEEIKIDDEKNEINVKNVSNNSKNKINKKNGTQNVQGADKE